ncbi:DUF2100 domain-containing protein [Methanobacterium formicicum]|uniref:DUF2100 domain-containing protein n=1 Tax=Methanobacterium formicicum (strain DSM 3637 / PP1) TaxID=1204725 RepID=K2QBK6_METFP|nr:DUF2100 domain-containing protein [Methanobacterium formicicum]EKF85326.1 hypothetical protein A994_09221 [Methanobacterium formicicum DSM 3637]
MDKIRFKQAQTLLKEAGQSQKSTEKLKTPQEGIVDSVTYAEILDNIIKTEEFIYSSRPSHRLLQEDAEEFCNQLINIRNRIDDILADFGVLEKENVEEEVKRLSERFILLTSKGNFKKILTRWGVEPLRIVVAGVPLEADDMRILNPKIPETALEPIKKKISHVKNDINRKMEQFNVQEILVVVENDKPGEILAKRAEDIYGAKVMMRDSLKDIDAIEFKKTLEL